MCINIIFIETCVYKRLSKLWFSGFLVASSQICSNLRLFILKKLKVKRYCHFNEYKSRPNILLLTTTKLSLVTERLTLSQAGCTCQVWHREDMEGVKVIQKETRGWASPLHVSPTFTSHTLTVKGPEMHYKEQRRNNCIFYDIFSSWSPTWSACHWQRRRECRKEWKRLKEGCVSLCVCVCSRAALANQQLS